MQSALGRLDVPRITRVAIWLALLAIYCESLFVRFSLLADNLASDACGQLLYPDIREFVSLIAPLGVTAPLLGFFTRPWPAVRLAVVTCGLATFAAFMFGARMSDVIQWSCDVGGTAIIDYVTGLVGILILLQMGIVSLLDFRRKAPGMAAPSRATIANSPPPHQR